MNLVVRPAVDDLTESLTKNQEELKEY